MRYLYFLFFLFFGICSHVAFAQSPPSCTGAVSGDINICGLPAGSDLGSKMSSCTADDPTRFLAQTSQCPSGPNKGVPVYRCFKSCTCPEGQKINQVGDPAVTECIPDEPSQSECPNGDCPPEEPPCPSGFPRVNGQCPVCVGGYNEDGTCADDDSGSSSSASSPPSSSPSSNPSSESPPPENPGGGDDGSSSSAGGGDDGSGGNPGGGTPGGGDGGSTGGGSASSASSTAGGTNGSSGSNNSWTPHSGYGNWIPISENSPCPNKYQDNQGQWWCAGGGSGEPNGAGQCDPTAANYLACITQDSNSGASSSACSPSSPDYLECSGKLENAQTDISGLADGFTEAIDEKEEELKTALTEDLDNFSAEGVGFKDEPGILRSALIALLPVSTSCNPPEFRFNGKTYELSCTYFNIFKETLGWFLAVLLAWNIWQMAIRPVDR